MKSIKLILGLLLFSITTIFAQVSVTEGWHRVASTAANEADGMLTLNADGNEVSIGVGVTYTSTNTERRSIYLDGVDEYSLSKFDKIRFVQKAFTDEIFVDVYVNASASVSASITSGNTGTDLTVVQFAAASIPVGYEAVEFDLGAIEFQKPYFTPFNRNQPGGTDSDADPLNEIQTISATYGVDSIEIFIAGGNSIKIPRGGNVAVAYAGGLLTINGVDYDLSDIDTDIESVTFTNNRLQVTEDGVTKEALILSEVSGNEIEKAADGGLYYSEIEYDHVTGVRANDAVIINEFFAGDRPYLIELDITEGATNKSWGDRNLVFQEGLSYGRTLYVKYRNDVDNKGYSLKTTFDGLQLNIDGSIQDTLYLEKEGDWAKLFVTSSNELTVLETNKGGASFSDTDVESVTFTNNRLQVTEDGVTKEALILSEENDNDLYLAVDGGIKYVDKNSYAYSEGAKLVNSVSSLNLNNNVNYWAEYNTAMGSQSSGTFATLSLDTAGIGSFRTVIVKHTESTNDLALNVVTNSSGFRDESVGITDTVSLAAGEWAIFLYTSDYFTVLKSSVGNAFDDTAIQTAITELQNRVDNDQQNQSLESTILKLDNADDVDLMELLTGGEADLCDCDITLDKTATGGLMANAVIRNGNQFIFDTSINAADGTYTIDWGDGVVNSYTITNSSLNAAPTHTFATAGIFQTEHKITTVNGEWKAIYFLNTDVSAGEAFGVGITTNEVSACPDAKNEISVINNVATNGNNWYGTNSTNVTVNGETATKTFESTGAGALLFAEVPAKAENGRIIATIDIDVNGVNETLIVYSDYNITASNCTVSTPFLDTIQEKITIDASQVTNFEIVEGAQGPAGADGAVGAVGAQGATGLTGEQGPAGADGLDGATGPAGPQGPAGADGAVGAVGAQGATGLTGEQGPAGADGLDGATGPAGPQGPAGADGAQGPIGLTGPAGADGLDGATGPQGPIGETGATGGDDQNLSNVLLQGNDGAAAQIKNIADATDSKDAVTLSQLQAGVQASYANTNLLLQNYEHKDSSQRFVDFRANMDSTGILLEMEDSIYEVVLLGDDVQDIANINYELRKTETFERLSTGDSVLIECHFLDSMSIQVSEICDTSIIEEIDCNSPILLKTAVFGNANIENDIFCINVNGNPASFFNLQNAVSPSTGCITLTSNTGWVAGAEIEELISSNAGYIEAVIPTDATGVGKSFVFGLIDTIQSYNNSNPPNNMVDYGYYVFYDYGQPNSYFYIEDGALTAGSLVHVANDAFRVEAENDSIVYKINGIKVRSVYNKYYDEDNVLIKKTVKEKVEELCPIVSENERLSHKSLTLTIAGERNGLSLDSVNQLLGFSNVENTFIAAYNGRNAFGSNSSHSIGLAYSTNGTDWIRFPNNPVVQTEGDLTRVCQPAFLEVGNTWYLYYSAERLGSSLEEVGLHTSVDRGKTWQNQGIVLGASATGWDSQRAYYPEVIYEPNDIGKEFKMWYFGLTGGTATGSSVGYAYSSDGINFTKYAGNPVLTTGASGTISDDHIIPGHVSKVGDTYYFFYSGNSGSTYNPILTTFTNPESNYTVSNTALVTQRTTALSNLTVDASIGDNTITVVDASVFENQEFVLIDDNNSKQQLVRVISKAGNVITLDRPVKKDYLLANAARIYSLYTLRLTIHDIEYDIEKSEYVAYISAFDGIDEYGIFATSSAIEGTYSFDFDRGVQLVNGEDGNWDATSIENFKGFRTDIPTHFFEAEKRVALAAEAIDLDDSENQVITGDLKILGVPLNEEFNIVCHNAAGCTITADVVIQSNSSTTGTSIVLSDGQFAKFIGIDRKWYIGQ